MTVQWKTLDPALSTFTMVTRYTEFCHKQQRSYDPRREASISHGIRQFPYVSFPTSVSLLSKLRQRRLQTRSTPTVLSCS